jgi:hypothetical protein
VNKRAPGLQALCVVTLTGLAAQAPLSASAVSASMIKEIAMEESAKRRAPTAKPVVHQGIRYEQLRRPDEHGFKQGGGVIGATDVASGKLLWAVQLYETQFDPKEERDAQEVYVSQLTLDAKAGVLVALDERKRQWQVRLSDRSVTALPPLPAKKKP